MCFPSFVCATRMEITTPMKFRSYPSGSTLDFLDSARIWEVARATSAAPSFFDPIKIGSFAESFSDGGTGANNPVLFLWSEAGDTFLGEGERLENRIKCLISVGTGKPSLKAFGNQLQPVAKTLLRMATDTQNTANAFNNTHSSLKEGHQYFRFNVEQGLENIGLEDAGQASTIMAATRHYLGSRELRAQMQDCARRLKSRGKRRPQTPSNRQLSLGRVQDDQSSSSRRTGCSIS